MKKFDFNKLMFPILVTATFIATGLLIWINDMAGIVAIYTGNVRSLIATLLYLVLWGFVLFIGYKQKNLFVIGYAGILWFASLMFFAILSTVEYFKDFTNYPVLETIWSYFIVFEGLFPAKRTFTLIKLVILIAAIFSCVSITLFCLVKRKHDNATKESFKIFIKSRTALVIFIANIAVIGLTLYCINEIV
jgi:hypothetical protein